MRIKADGGGVVMVKYCKICGLEIADTSVDSQGRFNAKKYCDECRMKRDKENRKAAKKRYADKKKLQKLKEQWAGWESISTQIEFFGEKEKELGARGQLTRGLQEEARLVKKSNARLRAKLGE